MEKESNISCVGTIILLALFVQKYLLRINQLLSIYQGVHITYFNIVSNIYIAGFPTFRFLVGKVVWHSFSDFRRFLLDLAPGIVFTMKQTFPTKIWVAKPLIGEKIDMPRLFHAPFKFFRKSYLLDFIQKSLTEYLQQKVKV